MKLKNENGSKKENGNGLTDEMRQAAIRRGREDGLSKVPVTYRTGGGPIWKQDHYDAVTVVVDVH